MVQYTGTTKGGIHVFSGRTGSSEAHAATIERSYFVFHEVPFAHFTRKNGHRAPTFMVSW